MQEQIARLTSQEFLGFIAIVGAFASGTVLGALALGFAYYHQGQKTRRSESLNALKQDMVARGMSPYDIASVLAAGIPDNKGQFLRPVGVG